MKNKLGLYAQYSKLDGSLIKSELKMSVDVYKSNNTNKSFLWELITDHKTDMYTMDINDIPKSASSWDIEMSKENHSDYFECDLCGRLYTEDEMHHIPTQEQLELGGCYECNNCSGLNN